MDPRTLTPSNIREAAYYRARIRELEQELMDMRRLNHLAADRRLVIEERAHPWRAFIRHSARAVRLRIEIWINDLKANQ